MKRLAIKAIWGSGSLPRAILPMKRQLALRAILPVKQLAFLLLAAGCASQVGSAPPAAPADARAAYQPRSAGPHVIEIRFNLRAARQILSFLSSPQYETAGAKLLREIPAVHLAIEDSGRPAEVFDRDLVAAFEEESRTAVFNFRPIRENRARWESLLQTIASREQELIAMAGERAAALLPADRPVTARTQVLLSFGLAGLADHLSLTGQEGRQVMIVDLARALGEAASEPVENQLARLARLIAGGAHRQAWTAYRQASPAWRTREAELGQLEPLLRTVVEAGPVALFSVDENFFPLSVWLKEPMKRSLSELNRIAERLVEAEGDLEKRVELTAEIRRPEFARRLAGPSGAFLSDAIIQAEGLDAFRSALSQGPRAFFRAYDRISREGRELIPLSRVIQERLGSSSPKSSSP